MIWQPSVPKEHTKINRHGSGSSKHAERVISRCCFADVGTTQHIAALLGATCSARLAAMFQRVVTFWVLKDSDFKLEPTTPNMSI